MSSLRKPIQIYLKPEQDRCLRVLAAQSGESISELIRRGVDLYLGGVPLEQDPAMRLVGLGRSGRGDLSANHDQVLAENERR